MFCKWVSDSFSVNISNETARRWLHYLGFNMNDHHKGVFFDGHDREDVVAYRNDLLKQLAKLDETTITPSTPCPSLADGEKKYIRIYHDESTFFANASHLERASWCWTSLWKGTDTYAMTRK